MSYQRHIALALEAPAASTLGRVSMGAMARLHMQRELALREFQQYLAFYALPYPFPEKTAPRERRRLARQGRKRGRTTRAVPAYPGAARIHGGSYGTAKAHEESRK